MRLLLVFLLLSILISFSTRGQGSEVRDQKKSSSLTSDSRTLTSEFILDNGLKILVIPNQKAPAVVHMVWYKVGAIDEASGKSGLAHFLEHLMFKGTKEVPAGEFSKIIARNGGQDNAFTSEDYTAYFQLIAKEHLPLVMKMEADRMQNLSFDEANVLRERKVIIEERRFRVDNDPSARLHEEMSASLYRNSRYGIHTIGWLHEMEKLSKEDAIDFYKTYYAPNNAILVIAGDVNPDEAIQLAKKYYGDISPSKNIKARIIAEEPPHRTRQELILNDKDVKAPEWHSYYLAPSIIKGESKYAFPLLVLAYILGNDNTGLLYRSLVEEIKIASRIAVYYDPLALGETVFGISVHAKKDGRMLKTLMPSTLNKITRKIGNKELENAKRALIADFTFNQDSLSGLAFFYGRALAIGLPLKEIENWSKNIEGVTLKDVGEAASAILSGLPVTGILEPEK